jgi:hypothetical protein
MFTRVGIVTLPLIVLAGMRRCPVERIHEKSIAVNGLALLVAATAVVAMLVLAKRRASAMASV